MVVKLVNINLGVLRNDDEDVGIFFIIVIGKSGLGKFCFVNVFIGEKVVIEGLVKILCIVIMNLYCI